MEHSPTSQDKDNVIENFWNAEKIFLDTCHSNVSSIIFIFVSFDICADFCDKKLL